MGGAEFETLGFQGQHAGCAQARRDRIARGRRCFASARLAFPLGP